MSENGRGHFEIPTNMRSMAEASVAQARQAFEKFISGAQAASAPRARTAQGEANRARHRHGKGDLRQGRLRIRRA